MAETKSTTQKITPCLWFDSQGEEAAKFYTSIFKNSEIGTITHYDEAAAKASGRPKGTVMTVTFKLDGQEFMALNGGPVFKMNPSISFIVECKTAKEVDDLWKKLSAGGEVMMPLDKYPFSEKYGWVQDKYGVSWQITVVMDKPGIYPSLMFTKKQFGRCEEALKFYTSVFKNSSIDFIARYEKGEHDKEGAIKFSAFTLGKERFAAMESSLDHKFEFNEGISLIVKCKDQEEIDHFWEKLSAGGEKGPCGWLKDKHGVSWQIVPMIMDEMMKSKDAKRTKNVMEVMLKMTKLEIDKLEKAYGQ